MKYIFSILLISFSAQTISAKASYSWWVTYTLEPTDTHFQNIKANEFFPEFDKIKILSCDIAPTFTKEQCADIKKSNLHLSITSDFNSDGKKETWHTGVAKNEDGMYFKFFFALDKNKKLIQAIPQTSKTPGFSIFVANDSNFLWAMCMYCGDLGYIKWSGKKWLLDWAGDYG
jgi:hypothetical protein